MKKVVRYESHSNYRLISNYKEIRNYRAPGSDKLGMYKVSGTYKNNRDFKGMKSNQKIRGIYETIGDYIAIVTKQRLLKLTSNLKGK